MAMRCVRVLIAFSALLNQYFTFKIMDPECAWAVHRTWHGVSAPVLQAKEGISERFVNWIGAMRDRRDLGDTERAVQIDKNEAADGGTGGLLGCAAVRFSIHSHLCSIRCLSATRL